MNILQEYMVSYKCTNKSHAKPIWKHLACTMATEQIWLLVMDNFGDALDCMGIPLLYFISFYVLHF